MEIYVVCAGAHGRVVSDILRTSCDPLSIRFAEQNEPMWGQAINGFPVVSLEIALEREPGSVGFVVALGKPGARLQLAGLIRQRGHRLVNAVHRNASVAETATLGSGTTVGAQAVINSNASVGDSVIVNNGAVVEHDAVLDDGVVVSPMAYVGARVHVAREAFISVGARIMGRVQVGAGAIIGANSLVLKDVPERTLWFGSPATYRGAVDDDFDWKRVL